MLNESQKVWKKGDKAKVWLMKKTANKRVSYSELDKKVNALLFKGVRCTKSSAITPKGIFSINNHNEKGWKNFVGRAKRMLAEKGLTKASANNLFFEMDYNFEEMRDIYNKIGGTQNNFPPYMQTKEEFEEYKKSHDIIVFEDTKTNRPIGFTTMGVYTKGSADFNEMEEDYNIKINRDILYYDTLAIDKDYQGSNVGREVVEIFNSFYSNLFDKTHDSFLVTGEINQNNKGEHSKGFHSKVLGFEIVGEMEVDSSKYEKRYETYKDKGYDNLSLSLANSYNRRGSKRA